jgi:hypothetical protein
VASPYRVSAPDASFPLRQCEMLTNVQRVQLVASSIGTSELANVVILTEYAIVLSQDCDLTQDHDVRFVKPNPDSDRLLPSVLLTPVLTATQVFARIANNNKKQWERLNIEKNKNERFHFLQKVEPASDRLNEELPELVIDFKRYFTLPTDELYRRIELGEAQRRCVLLSPYMEHLSSRFAYYLSRVGLPTDHLSE